MPSWEGGGGGKVTGAVAHMEEAETVPAIPAHACMQDPQARPCFAAIVSRLDTAKAFGAIAHMEEAETAARRQRLLELERVYAGLQQKQRERQERKAGAATRGVVPVQAGAEETGAATRGVVVVQAGGEAGPSAAAVGPNIGCQYNSRGEEGGESGVSPTTRSGRQNRSSGSTGVCCCM